MNKGRNFFALGEPFLRHADESHRLERPLFKQASLGAKEVSAERKQE
jgi:hypothetical protein